MQVIIRIRKQLRFLLKNKAIGLSLLLLVSVIQVSAQCLSSANPVGGTDNVLALEPRTLRFITFYKSGLGTNYYSGTKKTDYNLINKSEYSYGAVILGYGLNYKWSVELETGYFINKTQHYNLDATYKLRGFGLSDITPFVRYQLLTNHAHRVYVSTALGIKIPGRFKPHVINNVELPYQLQSSQGSMGLVLNSSFVKEDSGRGLRYFVTNRFSVSRPNYNDYTPGTAIFTSVYVSKHIISSKVKGDWTGIFQIRNEIRLPDKFNETDAASTGSILLFAVPQINYVLKEKWNISAMVDLPFYQNFKGTQLGAGFGATMVVSRAITFY